MPINTALYYYPKPLSLVHTERFSQQVKFHLYNAFISLKKFIDSQTRRGQTSRNIRNTEVSWNYCEPCVSFLMNSLVNIANFSAYERRHWNNFNQLYLRM